MMKISDRQKKLSLLVLLACTVILSACGNAATPEPTMDVNTFGTAAVQTIEAGYTETALANPTAAPAATDTPVPMPTESIPTQPQESIIVLPTGPEGEVSSLGTAQENSDENAVLPTVPPTALPTATLPANTIGDKASWEGQSPEDNAHVEAGSEFDITWYIRNTGSTTWTTDYCCRYFSNTNLSKRPGQRAYLLYNVAPNEVGECRIDAIAPTEPGTYKMAYVLSNAEDNNFYTVDITIIVD